jgi:GGDEF domain-containing protein
MRILLTREVQRCSRYQDFLTLCLIRALYPGAPLSDVDTSVSRRIAEMLRATDIVGAIGPDIAVLLVHTPDSDGAMIAERIRDRIQSEGRVTLSIGLASFPTDATSDAALLAHAQAQRRAAHQTG